MAGIYFAICMCVCGKFSHVAVRRKFDYSSSLFISALIKALPRVILCENVFPRVICSRISDSLMYYFNIKCGKNMTESAKFSVSSG